MSRCVLLMDHGSLEPASTVQLREIAAGLESRLDVRVRPVSLAHSAKVPSEKLGGRAAELFEAALEQELGDGIREIFVVPLFIGPSHAVVRHVPAVVAEKQQRFPAVCIGIAAPLYLAGDLRLAEILADHVRELVGDRSPRVAIVDHGSPSPAVTDVRNCLAAQVQALLGDAVKEVVACSMERRDGAEFAFNEPLLDTLLRQPGWTTGEVVIGMVFIGPGKHAGSQGDVFEICRQARGTSDGLKMTKLLGQHPLLLEILADRARHAFAVRGEL